MSLPALPTPGDGQRTALRSIDKAAVIYRLLQAEGVAPPLEDFAPEDRAGLEAALGRTASLGEAETAAIVDEFIARLRNGPPAPAAPLPAPVPVAAPGPGALPDLGLPDIAPLGFAGAATAEVAPDPWARVVDQDDEALAEILKAEAPEVGAVMLSKLKVGRAAGLLGQVPGPLARRIAYAVSRTSAISPEVVALIGEALGGSLQGPPPRAFEDGPVERVGAILNSTRAATRNDVLQGLDETDPDFAEAVRRAIFTFANIRARVDKRDIPKIVRRVEQPVLVTAIAAAQADPELAKSADFLLEALPQRMRDTITGEITELGEVREEDGETAMAALVGEIRAMEEAGEIYLIAGEEG